MYGSYGFVKIWGQHLWKGLSIKQDVLEPILDLLKDLKDVFHHGQVLMVHVNIALFRRTEVTGVSYCIRTQIMGQWTGIIWESSALALPARHELRPPKFSNLAAIYTRTKSTLDTSDAAHSGLGWYSSKNTPKAANPISRPSDWDMSAHSLARVSRQALD